MTLMQLRLLIFVVAAISLYLVKHSEVPRAKVISKSALMTESWPGYKYLFHFLAKSSKTAVCDVEAVSRAAR
jgi:hypothetical protein